MRQFFFNDDENNGKADDFADFDMDDLEAQLSIVAMGMEQKSKILKAAMQICEKSFWWKWMSVDKKLTELTKVYSTLELLTNSEVNIEFNAFIDDFDEMDEDDDDSEDDIYHREDEE